jgi:uncharacterized protein (TIRG00374 family)
MSKAKKSKYIFLFGRIAVVVGGILWAILWLSKGQRWDNLTQAFLRINIWVFALALSLSTIGQIIVAFRWWLLLRSQSIFIPFLPAVRLLFLGLFYNNFMPSSLGGDFLRAWYVTKHTNKKFEAALCVFVDRIIGLLSILVIAAFFYLLFLSGETLPISTKKNAGFLTFIAEHKIILILLFGCIVLVFSGLLLHGKGREMLKKICLNAISGILKLAEKFKKAVLLYCKKPLILLIAFGLTVFLQLMAITGFWFVGRNLGITVSIKYYYVFFTLTWALGAVPVSIGGAVVIEGMLVFLFSTFAGVEQEAALALALSQRIVWMLSSLPGAVIHLVGAHLPKDFFIDSENSIE